MCNWSVDCYLRKVSLVGRSVIIRWQREQGKSIVCCILERMTISGCAYFRIKNRSKGILTLADASCRKEPGFHKFSHTELLTATVYSNHINFLPKNQ